MEVYTRKFEVIEDCLKKLSDIKRDNPTFNQYRTSWKDKDAAERNIQKIVEAIIDLGKILISEKKLKEPSSNREVFQILAEERIFPLEYLSLIDKMIGMRNIIVHSYNKIEDEIVYGVLKKNLSDIRKLNSILKKVCLSKKPK